MHAMLHVWFLYKVGYEQSREKQAIPKTHQSPLAPVIFSCKRKLPGPRKSAMHAEGNAPAGNMFDVTAGASDEFLDPVMSSFLEIGSGTATQNLTTDHHPNQTSVSFRDLARGDSAVARAETTDDERQAQAHFIESNKLLRQGGSVSSPVSNEEEEPQEQSRLQSSNYVFGFGQPPSIQGPGVHANPKLFPLATSEAPQGILQTGLGSLGTSAKAEPIVESDLNPCRESEAAAVFDRFFPSTGSANAPPPARVEENESQGMISSILSNLLANPDSHVSSDQSAQNGGNVVLPSAHALIGSDQVQKMNQLFGQQQQQQQQRQHQHSKQLSEASEQTLFNQFQSPQNIVPQYQQRENHDIQFRSVEPHPPLQAPPQQNDAQPPFSTVSFMDMFQIASIPIPQISDWKMGPALVDCSDKVDHTATKLPKTGTGRVQKPGSGKRKSVGPKKPSKAKGSPKGGKPGPARKKAKGKDAAPISDDEKTGIIPPRMGNASSANAVQPSKFCHICLRRAGRVTLLACGNAFEGSCRKVVCKKCFETFGWDWKAACEPSSMWTCTHCREAYVYDAKTIL